MNYYLINQALIFKSRKSKVELLAKYFWCNMLYYHVYDIMYQYLSNIWLKNLKYYNEVK